MLSLLFFGGPVLADFAFTNVVGVIVGTYSSIFIAAPIVLWSSSFRKGNLRREVSKPQETSVKGKPVAAK
jgi:SecD/SecF fusion protein